VECELDYGAGFYLFPLWVIGTVVLAYTLKRRLKPHLNEHLGCLLALVFLFPALWLPMAIGLCGLNFIVASYIILVGLVAALVWHRPRGRETE
jgi:hypothetical protein